ncbi:Uncharacterised protein [uncultured archaeon]|nr:Uncharacterised protein [uncultured archaeon]
MRYEPKENALQRIKDAGEFIDSAEDNLAKGRFKAAIMNAGDAVIAANDAFTVFFIEEKASSDHSEAIAIHKKAGMKINENRLVILKDALDERHLYGYRPVQASKNTAEKDVANAKKFVKWVEEKIK